MEAVVAAVEALAAVSFAGGAISSTTVEIDAMKWWRSGDGGGFPSLAAPLPDRDGECRWEWQLRSTSCPEPASPPPLFMRSVTGAHQPYRVGRPRSGREKQGPKGHWA
jgi:hypothetical protein